MAGRWTVLLLLVLGLSRAEAAWHSDEQPIMGTRVHAELWHADAEEGKRLLAAVMAEMRRIDALMSPYIEDSELSRMNRRAASEPVTVSAELFELLVKSHRVSEITQGAFDVTYASVGRYYDYRKGERPDDATLEAAVAAIDYRYVELDPDTRTVRYAHPNVYVDLGGIAKGHAVDRCIALLQAAGVTQASVGAGGDSRLIGMRGSRPWSIGIQNPRNPDAMVAVLPLEDTAVSTSGDYERFFVEGGVRYHHILDPGTGDSARKVRSATILGMESTLSDALSTSLFVLGPKEGLALIDRIPGVDAILVDGAGRLHLSSELEELAE